MVKKITKRVVDAAETKAKRYTIFDSEVIGFGLRVYPTGKKSYIFEYRPGAGGRSEKKKRATIGSTTEFTPDEARKLADNLRSRVKVGEDPQSDKANERKAITVDALSQKFMSDHVEAKRAANTIDAYQDALKRYVLPKLGKMKAKDVNTSHVTRLHVDMKDMPSMANKVVAVVSSMFSFGFRMKLIPKSENPAEEVERYREEGKERYLSSAELERLGASFRLAETTGLPWEIDLTKKTKHLRKTRRETIIGEAPVAALRLLLFTGARLREILHLEWSHVDFERGILLLPKSKTGKKSIVLNAYALEILGSIRRVGRYVISGESAGMDDEKPRSDLKRPWEAIRRHAGLDDVRIHDLRHSFASFGAGGGMGLPIIGKLLGHSQSSTTQRYAHLDTDPVRQASDAIGSKIAGAISGKVIAIKGMRE